MAATVSLAVFNGHEEVVKPLLSVPEVEVNARDWKDRTPLLHAAANGHEVVVKLLLSTNKALATHVNKDGQTPLSMATANRHKTITPLLSDRVPKDFQVL